MPDKRFRFFQKLVGLPYLLALLGLLMPMANVSCTDQVIAEPSMYEIALGYDLGTELKEPGAGLLKRMEEGNPRSIERFKDFIPNFPKMEPMYHLFGIVGALVVAAIFAFIATVVLMYAGPKFGLTEDEMGVAGTYLLSVMGYVLLWRLIHPLNKFRIAVFVVCIIGMVLSIVVLWSIFIMAVVTFKGTLISIGYALACALILWLMSLKYPVEN